jgi:hypothetical protein
MRFLGLRLEAGRVGGESGQDKDARWTKKNEESFYGYKNHAGPLARWLAYAIPCQRFAETLACNCA